MSCLERPESVCLLFSSTVLEGKFDVMVETRKNEGWSERVLVKNVQWIDVPQLTESSVVIFLENLHV